MKMITSSMIFSSSFSSSRTEMADELLVFSEDRVQEPLWVEGDEVLIPLPYPC